MRTVEMKATAAEGGASLCGVQQGRPRKPRKQFRHFDADSLAAPIFFARPACVMLRFFYSTP